MEDLFPTLDTGVFKAIQMAGADILVSEEGDKYIEEKNIGFKHKQDIFVKGLKELGWKDFCIPSSTFYLWLPIPPRYKTSKEFTDDLSTPDVYEGPYRFDGNMVKFIKKYFEEK